MGILLDALATYMGKYANETFTTKGMFGLAVTCWFIGTEGISALKNFKEWKVAIPPFLKKAFGKVKKSANTLGK
jgi:phage-related holin